MLRFSSEMLRFIIDVHTILSISFPNRWMVLHLPVFVYYAIEYRLLIAKDLNCLDNDVVSDVVAMLVLLLVVCCLIQQTRPSVVITQCITTCIATSVVNCNIGWVDTPDLRTP